MPTTLRWSPDSIASIMQRNGITNRSGLADQLRQFGINKTTVYRAFDDHWAGTATTTVLAAIARTFRVPLGQLVTEPMERS